MITTLRPLSGLQTTMVRFEANVFNNLTSLSVPKYTRKFFMFLKIIKIFIGQHIKFVYKIVVAFCRVTLIIKSEST